PDHAPGTCGLIGAMGVGCGPSTGVEETVPVVPATACMKPARPNPFNPTTTIGFGVPRPGRVRIAVHDLAGRVVSVLIDAEMAPGEFSTEWNGRDGANRPAPSGIYFARMRAGGFSATRRLVLMR
ncbi:MAG: T9SS C-terminal target domain-containing protein, partial [Candidatus Latescibacterota bacterium]